MDVRTDRKEIIHGLAERVNAASEKYQLIHATFAIEKIQDDIRKELYRNEFKSIREQIAIARSESNKETVEFLLNKARGLSSNYQNTKVQVEYLPQINEGCARTYRTANGVFSISLPESMKDLRENGEIDFEKMKELRKLMAHELGHIMLHADFLGPTRKEMTEVEEAEADYFAEVLIELRKKRNKEIHENQKYQEF